MFDYPQLQAENVSFHSNGVLVKACQKIEVLNNRELAEGYPSAVSEVRTVRPSPVTLLECASRRCRASSDD